MADPHDLVHRATTWEDDAIKLDRIMADMSTLSESQFSLVSQAARLLLLNASVGGRNLNEYQSALCHVYVVRGCNMDAHTCTVDERTHALHGIRKAGVHLETLRMALKPVAALGVLEEHQQLKDLATKIEELSSFWQPLQPTEPTEPPRHVHFGAPSLGQAQWLLDRAIAYGGWSCVGYLGKSHIWSTRPLWTKHTGLSAAGLLSDPTFKLLNFLNKLRTPDGKSLNGAKLWMEVVRCEKIWNGLDPDDVAVAAHVAPGLKSSDFKEWFHFDDP